MNKTEEIKKFLKELNESEEGKKLLQEANSQEVIKVGTVAEQQKGTVNDTAKENGKEEKQTPKELVVEPNKEVKSEIVNLAIKSQIEQEEMMKALETFPKKDLVVEPNKEDKKEQDKKKKKDASWWSKTFNKDKFKKTNKVAVVFLRDNGNVDLMEMETRNGFFTINGKPYHEDRDCVYTITKDRIPLIIVREWDIVPLGTKKWDDESMRQKFAELEQHVLKGIRAAEMVRSGGDTDSKLTPKQLILWGLAALVGTIIIMNFI